VEVALPAGFAGLLAAVAVDRWGNVSAPWELAVGGGN
jgi:hypothetical protein